MAYAAVPGHVQRNWREDTVSQGRPLSLHAANADYWLPSYIFGAANVITIPMVWALYPETNQRTLEEIDLLFEADSPWVWDAEKHFAKLLEENPNRVLAASRGNSVVDPEAGVKKADHADTASEERQEVAHVDNKD